MSKQNSPRKLTMSYWGYFKYVVREEGLTHSPENWRQAKDMYEKIVFFQSPHCLFHVILRD